MTYCMSCNGKGEKNVENQPLVVGVRSITRPRARRMDGRIEDRFLEGKVNKDEESE